MEEEKDERRQKEEMNKIKNGPGKKKETNKQTNKQPLFQPLCSIAWLLSSADAHSMEQSISSLVEFAHLQCLSTLALSLSELAKSLRFSSNHSSCRKMG